MARKKKRPRRRGLGFDALERRFLLSATDWWLDDTAWWDQDWWVEDPAPPESWDEGVLPGDEWGYDFSGEFDAGWPTTDDVPEDPSPEVNGDDAGGWVGEEPVGDPAEETSGTGSDAEVGDADRQDDVVAPVDDPVTPPDELQVEAELGGVWPEDAGGSDAPVDGTEDALGDVLDEDPLALEEDRLDLEEDLSDQEPADTHATDDESSPGDEFVPTPVDWSEFDGPSPEPQDPIPLPVDTAVEGDADTPTSAPDDVGQSTTTDPVDEPVAGWVLDAGAEQPVLVAVTAQPVPVAPTAPAPAAGSPDGPRASTWAGFLGRGGVFGFGFAWGSGSGDDGDGSSSLPGRRRSRWPFRPAD
jgi:hypothetical protein